MKFVNKRILKIVSNPSWTNPSNQTRVDLDWADQLHHIPSINLHKARISKAITRKRSINSVNLKKKKIRFHTSRNNGENFESIWRTTQTSAICTIYEKRQSQSWWPQMGKQSSLISLLVHYKVIQWKGRGTWPSATQKKKPESGTCNRPRFHRWSHHSSRWNSIQPRNWRLHHKS